MMLRVRCQPHGTYVRASYYLKVVLINYKVYGSVHMLCLYFTKRWMIYFQRFCLFKRTDEVKHTRSGEYYSDGSVQYF